MSILNKQMYAYVCIGLFEIYRETFTVCITNMYCYLRRNYKSKFSGLVVLVIGAITITIKQMLIIIGSSYNL